MDALRNRGWSVKPTIELLNAIVSYDPATGEFLWLERPVRSFRDKGWNTRFAGKVATKPRADGYLTIRTSDRHYRASRIAWAYMTGAWPPDDLDVDHENLCRADNRWSNLRLAPRGLNIANRRVRRDSVSGRKGVQWHVGTGKWAVKIGTKGRQIHIGLFADIEAAAAAYATAAAKYHGEFARTE